MLKEEKVVKCVEERLFEEWQDSAKSNTTLVNHSDLDEIRCYLTSSKDNNPCNINAVLKRRIKRNKFIIANFPSDVDCVCVLRSDVQVSS